MKGVLFAVVLVCVASEIRGYLDEKEEKLPTKCHVCKHMAREMSEELGRSGKSHDVLYLGQVFQKERKKVDYRRSELRLTEALEKACSNVLDYKVHKDKPLTLRYEKVESVTFKTLKNLKKRGVKVDLGFPDQMWDTPDAEITRLKTKCEYMVEQYEDAITQWYWHHPDENLTQWLCVERVLDPKETDCLNKNTAEKKSDTDDMSSKDTEKGGKERGNETKRKQTHTEGTKKKQRKVENEIKEEVEVKKGKKKKTKGKKKRSKNSDKNKIKHHKTSDPNKGESDSEKIQRLIREQSEEQSKGFGKYSQESRMEKGKQKMLRIRLSQIDDPKKFRREIRKIRLQELSEDEYFPKQPWEGKLDSSYPAEVLRHMRQQAYEAVENAEDFRQEVELRMFERESDFNFPERDLRQVYLNEAETVRDLNELRQRLQDLDALSAIFGKRRRGRDEL